MKLRRRSFLLAAAAAAAAAPAKAEGVNELEIFFRDDALRDVLVMRLGDATMIWHARMFGENAYFVLARTSGQRYVSKAPMLTPPRAEALSWQPSTWKLRVERAAFPGGREHRLLFTLSRKELPKRAGFTRWTAMMAIAGWPRQGHAWRSDEIDLQQFFEGAAALSCGLPQAAAQAGLEDWFGRRAEIFSSATLSMENDCAWTVRAEAGKLFILDVAAPQSASPFGFGSLIVQRVFPPGGPPELPKPRGVPPAFLTAAAPAVPSPVMTGLHGDLADSASPTSAQAFELGYRGDFRLTLKLSERTGLQAALHQWGDPSRAVAGAWLYGPDRSRATLTIGRGDGKGQAHAFEIARFEIARQLRANTLVHTDSDLFPCDKPFTIETAFGRLVVGAAPAVMPRPGTGSRVPPIRVETLDREDVKDRRAITKFDAVLALTSLSVRLPTFSDTEDSGPPHVARLDFDGAECRFVLDSMPEFATADALVPLGEPAAGALFDLGRAKLTVLRPADLLSLCFRFSGLLLDVPHPSTERRIRMLPSRGGPVCRGGAPSDAFAVRDLRPILVVTFPPQHVAEQAYYRQVPTLVLPVLATPDQHRALLDEVRQLRAADRATDSEENRRKRVEKLRAFKAAGPVFSGQAGFVAEFERRAPLDEDNKSRFPAEQCIYAGPEFLDPAARKLAFDILSKLARGTSGDAVYAFALEQTIVEAELMPFDLTPAKLGPETKHEALAALERAKERANSTYAEFRHAYLKKWKTPYLGPDWVRTAGPKQEAWAEAWRPELEPIHAVTPARLSGPSRLAFRINCDDYQAERRGGGFTFSLEALTDWGSMDLAVVRRAERLFETQEHGPMLPLWARVGVVDDARILSHQSLSRGDHLAIESDRARRGGASTSWRDAAMNIPGPVDALTRLAEIVAATRDRPDPFQTAIELPFRLFLSPAQDATWRVPQEAVRRKAFNNNPAPDPWIGLWSASLAGSGVQSGVRAIWSPDFRPAALLSTRGPGAPPHGPWAPWALPKTTDIRGNLPADALPRFRTSLDAYDRHELVVLSSVYGLPVLGRRNLQGGLMDGSQFDPPDGFRLAGLRMDAPASGSLPSADYSAIYRPEPLSMAELTLTALGGSLDHDTAFVPPASARYIDGPNLFDALSIERWRNRTVLGRDILVEVAYKGFLFPIGHKATLVKLTERRFERSADGRPFAVLIQRQFLRVGDPVKVFPAYDHPNSGRRWPATRVEMLTRRTPDLVEPEPITGLGTGRVFWPSVTAGEGGEVLFEMRIDDEGGSGSMPLLFIDNTAAHDEPTTRKLVAHYDQKVSAEMRRLPRNGQPVRTAPSKDTGDTTYETDWWLLRAEGRSTAPSPQKPDAAASFDIINDRYHVDPFMEGLDQPGFYPLIETARIRLTKVERMTGRPTVWAEAAYDGRYTAAGFLTDGDAADDLFLRIVGPSIPMRMGGSDHSGGVMQPDTNVVGISRAQGPIGAANPVPAAPASATSVPSISTHAKQLDPAKLFDNGAKLLGLIKLQDVLSFAAGLSSQPKLQELTEYGADLSRRAGQARGLLTKSVLQPMCEAVALLLEQWKALLTKLDGLSHLDLIGSFPQIGTAIGALRDSLDASLTANLDDAAFYASLARVYESGPCSSKNCRQANRRRSDVKSMKADRG